ncbi:hypothetical protein [Halalkalibacter alkalisediminis]|uniref:Uncharacterized protein n=1 Tax=Halalkalibacter alkalisediminis TaxID=935616 RepID=A0ABV6NG27_9BACI|nr:hypothetical protein [Halalkalibacter alkalisediminis]
MNTKQDQLILADLLKIFEPKNLVRFGGFPALNRVETITWGYHSIKKWYQLKVVESYEWEYRGNV